jgi:hypothetical protein
MPCTARVPSRPQGSSRGARLAALEVEAWPLDAPLAAAPEVAKLEEEEEEEEEEELEELASATLLPPSSAALTCMWLREGEGALRRERLVMGAAAGAAAEAELAQAAAAASPASSAAPGDASGKPQPAVKSSTQPPSLNTPLMPLFKCVDGPAAAAPGVAPTGDKMPAERERADGAVSEREGSVCKCKGRESSWPSQRTSVKLAG